MEHALLRNFYGEVYKNGSPSYIHQHLIMLCYKKAIKKKRPLASGNSSITARLLTEFFASRRSELVQGVEGKVPCGMLGGQGV